ncbi:hypothetical protein EWM62_13495 [Mucilaginibacter terrigena]|uniref:Lipocalin-like domain-containing protein n=1 Tax=Mucilaginibacter terrigena TaxID=2492395 RepID=A0A4Q5LIV0_9SPHI|nr:hypothetical protein [Mucilaginibacter terrigena]RYU89341.1 hypothetical protein EWM62_13495 [Mucilaginibacter terrigena]
MKKTLSIVLFSATILLAACTKKSDDPVIPSNSWSLNGTEHVVANTSRTIGPNSETAILYKDDTEGGKATVSLSFKTLPAASGSYQLVASNASLTDNQCHITLTNDNGNTAYFTGDPVAVDVLVTANNQVIVNIPEINVAVPSPGDTYKFKASLYEK